MFFFLPFFTVVFGTAPVVVVKNIAFVGCVVVVVISMVVGVPMVVVVDGAIEVDRNFSFIDVGG